MPENSRKDDAVGLFDHYHPLTKSLQRVEKASDRHTQTLGLRSATVFDCAVSQGWTEDGSGLAIGQRLAWFESNRPEMGPVTF